MWQEKLADSGEDHREFVADLVNDQAEQNNTDRKRPDLDPFEDIMLKKVPLKDLGDFVVSQKQGVHGLMLATYALFQHAVK